MADIQTNETPSATDSTPATATTAPTSGAFRVHFHSPRSFFLDQVIRESPDPAQLTMNAAVLSHLSDSGILSPRLKLFSHSDDSGGTKLKLEPRFAQPLTGDVSQLDKYGESIASLGVVPFGLESLKQADTSDMVEEEGGQFLLKSWEEIFSAFSRRTEAEQELFRDLWEIYTKNQKEGDETNAKLDSEFWAYQKSSKKGKEKISPTASRNGAKQVEIGTRNHNSRVLLDSFVNHIRHENDNLSDTVEDVQAILEIYRDHISAEEPEADKKEIKMIDTLISHLEYEKLKHLVSETRITSQREAHDISQDAQYVPPLHTRTVGPDCSRMTDLMNRLRKVKQDISKQSAEVTLDEATQEVKSAADILVTLDPTEGQIGLKKAERYVRWDREPTGSVTSAPRYEQPESYRIAPLSGARYIIESYDRRIVNTKDFGVDVPALVPVQGADTIKWVSGLDIVGQSLEWGDHVRKQFHREWLDEYEGEPLVLPLQDQTAAAFTGDGFPKNGLGYGSSLLKAAQSLYTANSKIKKSKAQQQISLLASENHSAWKKANQETNLEIQRTQLDYAREARNIPAVASDAIKKMKYGRQLAIQDANLRAVETLGPLTDDERKWLTASEYALMASSYRDLTDLHTALAVSNSLKLKENHVDRLTRYFQKTGKRQRQDYLDTANAIRSALPSSEVEMTFEEWLSSRKQVPRPVQQTKSVDESVKGKKKKKKAKGKTGAASSITSIANSPVPDAGEIAFSTVLGGRMPPTAELYNLNLTGDKSHSREIATVEPSTADLPDGSIETEWSPENDRWETYIGSDAKRDESVEGESGWSKSTRTGGESRSKPKRWAPMSWHAHEREPITVGYASALQKDIERRKTLLASQSGSVETPQSKSYSAVGVELENMPDPAPLSEEARQAIDEAKQLQSDLIKLREELGNAPFS